MNLSNEELTLVAWLIQLYNESQRHSKQCICDFCKCFDEISSTRSVVIESLWDKAKLGLPFDFKQQQQLLLG